MRCWSRAWAPLQATALCTVLAGCGASKPFPEKDFFAIEAGSPQAAATRVSESTLRVRRLRIATPYDGRSFVYKVGEAKFESDYYNGFVAEPEQLLTGELVQWLSRSGLFGSVVGSSVGADHSFVLEGVVTALYGDYSEADAAQAVMEAKFFLLDDRGAETRVVFQKPYRKAAPLEGDKAAALVAAWGQVYRGILMELTADLGRLDLTGRSATGANRGGGD